MARDNQNKRIDGDGKKKQRDSYNSDSSVQAGRFLAEIRVCRSVLKSDSGEKFVGIVFRKMVAGLKRVRNGKKNGSREFDDLADETVPSIRLD